MKSKLAFVRQPDSIPRKTAFSLRCFAAILLRLPPETKAHSTPFQGGEQNRIRSQTVHQEQSCWAVFLFGGDTYSVSAFQNHHRQAQPRSVRCCRGRLSERRTAVQRVRPENKILQQEEGTWWCWPSPPRSPAHPRPRVSPTTRVSADAQHVISYRQTSRPSDGRSQRVDKPHPCHSEERSDVGIRIFLDRNLRKMQDLCVLETDCHASVRSGSQ